MSPLHPVSKLKARTLGNCGCYCWIQGVGVAQLSDSTIFYSFNSSHNWACFQFYISILYICTIYKYNISQYHSSYLTLLKTALACDKRYSTSLELFKSSIRRNPPRWSSLSLTSELGNLKSKKQNYVMGVVFSGWGVGLLSQR